MELESREESGRSRWSVGEVSKKQVHLLVMLLDRLVPPS